MVESTAPLGVIAIIFALGVILLMVRDVVAALWQVLPDWLKVTFFVGLAVAAFAVANRLLQ